MNVLGLLAGPVPEFLVDDLAGVSDAVGPVKSPFPN